MPRGKQNDTKLPAMDPADFDKEAVFEALSYEPDDWQRLFHDAEARYRVLACGVRVGKTYSLVPEAVAGALCPSKKSLEEGEWVGSRGWIVAPTYDVADKLFLQVARHMKSKFSWLITSYSERLRIVRTIGGGYFQAKSSDNPDSLIAEELDWAILDEAPRIKEHDKEQVRQRLLTRGGWMAAIGSPVPCRWFERDFERGQGQGYSYEFEGEPLNKKVQYAGRKVKFVPGDGDYNEDYFSIRVPTHANKRLEAKMLAEMETTMPERILRQDVLAEFMSADGTVFSGFSKLATAERLAHGRPDRRYVIAWDVARAKDYSAISVMDYKTCEQVFTARFQGPWNVQYDRIERICRAFCNGPNRPDLVIDSHGKGDAPYNEMLTRNYRYQMVSGRDLKKLTPVEREQAKMGPFAQMVEPMPVHNNQVKRELVETLAAAIDQQELKIIDDPVQNQELRVYEYKQSDATGVIRYGAPSGFHDDTVIALALSWWRCSRPRGTGKFIMF